MHHLTQDPQPSQGLYGGSMLHVSQIKNIVISEGDSGQAFISKTVMYQCLIILKRKGELPTSDQTSENFPNSLGCWQKIHQPTKQKHSMSQ